MSAQVIDGIDVASSSTRASTRRLASIDIVRGAIIVLMALDHVRDFVSIDRFPPEDLTRASVALFATRWITHFCAPTFFLLAGVGIGIARLRGAAPAETSRYLFTRGLWLLVLELVITPIGWQFGFDLVPAFALVLWGLGWSMIVMALAIHLPTAALAVLALLMICAHNLLDPIRADSLGALAGLWHFLHAPGFIVPGKLLVTYPLIPWVAVMALGYSIAQVYAWEEIRRRRFFIAAGTVAIAMFVLLRAFNGYGDPRHWSELQTPALTVAFFLNVVKYPPSLLFLLMTLGPALIALAFAERLRGRLATWLSVYGRVPLFFYVIHIFIAHLAGMLLALVQTGGLHRIPVVSDPSAVPPGFGVPLGGVYLAWVAVVIALYGPCRYFARLKDTRDDWYLRYL